MATLEEAIYNWMITQSDITAYVGRDIYFLAAPDKLDTDYIRYAAIVPSNEPYAFNCTDTAYPEIQFDIFSKDYSHCVEIGTLLATALNRFQGTLDTGLNVIYSTASGPMVIRDISDEQWWHGIVYWNPEYER